MGIDGSAKGATGWFDANRATAYVDHPVHAPYGRTLNIDVFNPTLGLSARVVLELTEESPRTYRGEGVGAGRCQLPGDCPRAGGLASKDR